VNAKYKKLLTSILSADFEQTMKQHPATN